MNQSSPSQEPNPNSERRRTTRLSESVPIKISGNDALGKSFQETTATLTFDCYGCKYQSTHYLPKNSKVTVEVIQSEPRAKRRVVQAVVVWVERPKTYRDFYGVAVEFEVPGNVWEIESPPDDWFPLPGEEIPAEKSVEYAAGPANGTSVIESPGASGGGSESSVAVAEEVVLDCTVDMTAPWDSSAGPAQLRAATEREAESEARASSQLAAIEAVTEQMEMIRRQFDACMRETVQQCENHITAALEELRKEVHALREAVTASTANKAKSGGNRRKPKQSPQEVQ
ncbi:MAG: hypothetical protein WB630_16640 [Candidatus Acidiferrales bacterium]